MGTYKRAGSEFYWFRFIYRGRRIQQSTRQGDKETAKQMESAERTRLARIDAGLESVEPKAKQKPVTCGDHLDGLVAHYEREGKASRKNLSTIGRARLAFGGKKTLTDADIESYISAQHRKGRKSATINRILEVVRRAYRIAKVALPAIRHLREDNVRTGFFSGDELERVVDALPESLMDFVRFGFVTAWRKGEVASLKWSDVEDGVIRLRAKNAKNREARHVVIDGDLTNIIKRRRALRAVETPDGTLLSEYIFHRDGQPVREFRKSWARACVTAKVGVMRCPKCGSEGEALTCCKRPTKYRGKIFHDLRRSGVRDMIRSGVPQNVAMRVSGHRTASMFRRYDVCSEVDLRQAMVSIQRYREAERQKVVAMTAREGAVAP